MQVARSKAGVFTKGNKLFVFNGIDLEFNSLKSSEVYDSISKKFTFIVSNANICSNHLFCTNSNGNNIIVIYDNYYCFYNINTNTWSDKYCLDFEKNIYDYSCVELSKLINWKLLCSLRLVLTDYFQCIFEVNVANKFKNI